MAYGIEIRVRYFCWLLAIALAAGCAATSTPNYRDILTSPNRPDAEKALDAVRKPHEVVAFYGVKRGDKVADILAARGYYTAILSQIVGPEGIVYSANATARPELHERAKQPSMANVRIIEARLIRSPCLRTVRSISFSFISTIMSCRPTRESR